MSLSFAYLFIHMATLMTGRRVDVQRSFVQQIFEKHMIGRTNSCKTDTFTTRRLRPLVQSLNLYNGELKKYCYTAGQFCNAQYSKYHY